MFLFLEQIAPSSAAHAPSCHEDFCGCRAGEMASEIPEIVYTFGPLLNTFMSVGILLKDPFSLTVMLCALLVVKRGH